MASHFPCIGVVVAPGGMFDLLDHIGRTGRRTTTPHGDYVSWNAGMGPEVWLYLDGMNFQEMAPHFSGGSRVHCRLNNELHRELGETQQVALQGWLNPKKGIPGGDCPIVFDCPDYHVHGAPSFPHECEVQFALFPISIGLFQDENEWMSSQKRRPLIPSRWIGAVRSSHSGLPRSEVAGAGRVVQSQVMTNALTGQAFVAVQFETNQGVFDLVLPDAADSQKLRPGSIIGGTLLAFRTDLAKRRAATVAQDLESVK